MKSVLFPVETDLLELPEPHASWLRAVFPSARHVLMNALMPVATLQSEVFRQVLAGSVVVETVFVIPGMSRLLVDGMLAQDYAVVQGVILVVAMAVVLCNLLVDLLYGWLDPRIQYT